MIIGIITHKELSNEKHKINVIYNDVVKAIKSVGGIPLGIVLDDNYKKVLDICDGVIFQGGDNPELIDFYALKYLYDINKPVLGICLGMQTMGILFNGKIIPVKNHKTNLKYMHGVKILKTSNLYKIIKNDYIKVNSRHKYKLINTDLDVVGLSDDGTIEAIEDKNKNFFLGVQWHPESMINYDKLQNNIFKYFIKSIENFIKNTQSNV